jgi:SAM-dependent methyltransferase
MSWSEAWDEGRTPWDAGAEAPALVELIEQRKIGGKRALVPGCGSGYDALALAEVFDEVVGMDVADGAIERMEALRDERGISAHRVRAIRADFFEFEPDAPFDLIYDYTFLCAIEPQRRQEWARRVEALLAEGGELVTLIFPVVDKPADEGPPYPMSPELVRDLLTPESEAFEFEALELREVTVSNEGREGMEWLGRWQRLGRGSGQC